VLLHGSSQIPWPFAGAPVSCSGADVNASTPSNGVARGPGRRPLCQTRRFFFHSTRHVGSSPRQPWWARKGQRRDGFVPDTACWDSLRCRKAQRPATAPHRGRSAPSVAVKRVQASATRLPCAALSSSTLGPFPRPKSNANACSIVETATMQLAAGRWPLACHAVTALTLQTRQDSGRYPPRSHPTATLCIIVLMESLSSL
jgi:hypothetical protein